MLVHQILREQWHRLKPVYEEQGDSLPAAEQNTAVVAEDGGSIIAMCGVNLIAHLGPLWVASQWRGRGISDKVAAGADQLIRELGAKGYLMFPSNKGAAAVAQRLGLERMTWEVYRREF